MFARFALVGLACFLHCTTAAAQEVAGALKQECEGEILVLRHSLQNNSQKYDSEGKVLRGGPEGPWTLYGRIKVDQVELSPDKLLLRGHHVDYKYVRSAHRLTPFPNKVKMQVEISLKGLPASLAEAEEVLGRVFALTKKEVLQSVPEFWRPYLESYIPPVAQEKNPRQQPKTALGQPDKIATIGHGVQPPQPVFTPEPAFTDRASREDFEGIVVLNVVINKTGRVQNIRLVRPLGMGMDEAAVDTVKTWRFKPSTRNGEPMDVEMNIEVAFNKT
jgi:TonB family protein